MSEEDFAQLLAAIQLYCCSYGSVRQIAALKGRLTKLINRLGKKYGGWRVRPDVLLAIQVFELLKVDEGRLDNLRQRVTFGSLYCEGERVFGWYSLQQTQAEALPLSLQGWGYRVDFYGFGKSLSLWNKRGFEPAIKLPYMDTCELGLWVSFRREEADFWKEWGYARAEALPYSWIDGALCVTRNIKDYGFWNAYKWWPGCQDWYKEKHPDWFNYLSR